MLNSPQQNKAPYKFKIKDLDYVVEQIHLDVESSINRTKLLNNLEQLKSQLPSHQNCAISTIDTINTTIAIMKRVDCRKNRGSLKRQTFWTLTMTQALIAIIMTTTSHKRWIKYKLAHIIKTLPHNWLKLYHNPPPSTIYYLFNTHTKMDYIGESNQWRTRFFSEITDAHKLSCLLNYNDHPKYQSEISTKKHKYPYSIRVIQRQGIEHWISIPIRDLSEFSNPNTSSIIRKRYEKHLIQSINPHMNTKGLSTNRYSKTKSSQRSRPPIFMRKRSKTCPTHQTPLSLCHHDCWIQQRNDPIPALANYIIHNTTRPITTTTTTLALDTYIQNQPPNQKLTIFKIPHKKDLTNWQNIKFYHKNLAGPDAKILLKSTQKYRKTGFKIHTTGMNYQEFIDKHLKKLSNHQCSWKSLLRKATIHTLFDLLYRCTTIITNPTTLARTTYRIKSVIKQKCGLQNPPTFTVSYPYDHRVDQTELKHIMHKIIESTSLTENIKDQIKSQFRIVNTNRKNIAEMLTNTKQACNNFNPEIEPECIHHDL